jgi:hypothetical protein
MDSYLQIAEDVLRHVRRPLSALQILRAAYEHGVAPAHLRGQTQQKTLGARLSEDILDQRENSRFYRTAPGRFMLRELANDPSIPEELRQPIVARRRLRDLVQKRSLAFNWSALKHSEQPNAVIDNSVILHLINQGEFHYASSSRARNADEIVVWAFVLVVKDGAVLTYRQGHYRENRDTFMHRRTIGFYTPVADHDLSLFDQEDHGIVSSGIRALATDLDLQDPDLRSLLIKGSELRAFVLPREPSSRDLLAVVSFSCPDWLDPTTKRLAINDLQWMDLRTQPNHEEDFDPWSQTILHETRNLMLGSL